MDRVLHGYQGCSCFLICAAVLAGLLLVWFFRKLERTCKLVPGPWGLPFVGNLPIFSSGTAHRKLAEIAKVYGPVFAIKLGHTNVLVLNNIDSVKEALIHRGSDFLGRPPLTTILHLSYGGKSVAFTDYSSEYLRNKQATAAAMNILLYSTESYESRVSKIAHNLITSFMQSNEMDFDPQPLIKSAVAELMFRILFGDELPRHYVLEAQSLAEKFTIFTEASTVGSCVDFLFLVRWLSVDQFKRVDSCYVELVQFIRMVNIARISLVPNEFLQCSCIARVLQDTRTRRNSLPLSQDNGPEQQELSNETIDHLLAELFIFGCEKLSAAITWMIVFVGKDPKLQEYLYKELNQGNKSSLILSLTDKTDLPILEATVLEVLRAACPFPFAIPHSTVRETTVANYEIPKNTIVFINLWACCHDPKYYENPSIFNPFRFLDNQKKKLTKPFCVPSFSVGERRCFADGLAKGILFLVTGNILSNFHLEVMEHTSTEQEKVTLTLCPKLFRLRARTRHSEKFII